MVRSRTPTRRRFLTGGGVALGLLAGCSERDADAPDDADETDAPADADETDAPTDADDTDGSDDADETDAPADADETDGSDDADLDLREANVVDVVAEPVDAGYAFDVTLHHDDDGEEGYADWWQVERLDGSRLGRRELLHAHSEQPFTRSETVAVPTGVDCVVVRGHDETHGYGGVAAAVDLDAGAVHRVDQGADPSSFDSSDCP